MKLLEWIIMALRNAKGSFVKSPFKVALEEIDKENLYDGGAKAETAAEALENGDFNPNHFYRVPANKRVDLPMRKEINQEVEEI